MGWFANLFGSSSSNINARRKMTMSTHDAFSLPTSSPITSSHHASFARSAVETPDSDPASSSSYAYPPPSTSSPTTYDYVPRMNGRLPSSQSRPPSLLPLHNTSSRSPLPLYPPLEQTWARLRDWLSREYPELGDTLNYGILPQDMSEIEMALGTSLPQPVRESYLLVDGQEAESSAGCSEGLFFGLTFLPLEDVLEEWRFWREVDEDPTTGANSRLKNLMLSIPEGWVRRVYSSRGWIPLVTDKVGNYLGVDLSPDERGTVGQVIVFGRDFDTKVVLWRGDGPGGWARWLAGFVEDLESGEGYELGPSSDGSESEDSVGYESYFFDGSGRTRGEGGGDAGAGLRLTGEYRGWNVLEAWADKSVKKWRESGILPVQLDSPSVMTGKGSARLGLGVLDSSASAEVPIPVVADEEQDQKTPTKALTNVTNRVANSANAGQNPLGPLPTISVTKPPAPRPVELPSPHDFQSFSPVDSRATSFDQDLERGRQLSLDEVDHPLSTAAVPVKSQSPVTSPTSEGKNNAFSSVTEAALVPLPPSTSRLGSPSTITHDLLQQNDSSEGVSIPAMEPATTPTADKTPINDLLMETPLSPVEPSDTQPEEASQQADQTIRLVGGGGMSGIVAEPEPLGEVEREPDLADVASVTSRASTDADVSQNPGRSKHEKKTSFSSNLKRISRLGSGTAKRKTESKDKI